MNFSHFIKIKIEKLVVEHCSGKRFTFGQAKVTGKKQALLDERDPKEEQEAKMKRREANRQMAEKMREIIEINRQRSQSKTY